MIKKLKLLIFPTLLFSLASCTVKKEIHRWNFYFDTYCDYKLFEGDVNNVIDIDDILSKIDKLTDNFNERDLNNIYKINNTNENVEIEPELYEILDFCFSEKIKSLNYFNPFIGSLSKKWKEALNKEEVLSNSVIDEELTKMATSSLEFVNENTVKRNGEAEIDLGAVAKGYALDKIKSYLDKLEIKKYIVDLGSSSILLGEKQSDEYFTVQISNLDGAYLMLKNCVVSTSSYERQKVEIDGEIYSHIINPKSGSAKNENDAVIVISDKGYIGDILSTDFVNESIDSIKELEQSFNVKSIVIKDKKIVYQNEEIEVIVNE